MTGELAPARHVPSAATRDWEPGSYPPHDGATGDGARTQADPTLAIDTSGRTERNRPEGKDSATLPLRKLKRDFWGLRRILGIILWIALSVPIPKFTFDAARP